eukprot:m.37506 g.37506  ORF g.37506 m.37506 type:complete len:626 (+) comp11108_c0_seq2:145-2022(+)
MASFDGSGGGGAGAGGAPTFVPGATAFDPTSSFPANPTVAEFTPSAPSFQPSVSSPEFTPTVPAGIHAPEFRPGNAVGSAVGVPAVDLAAVAATAAPFQPGGTSSDDQTPGAVSALPPSFEPQASQDAAQPPPPSALPAHHMPSTAPSSSYSHQAHHNQQLHHHHQHGAPGGTTYYYEPSSQPRVPFPHVLPHVADLDAIAAAQHSFFMSEDLRAELVARQQVTELQVEPGSVPGVPSQVDNYHSLMPLEPPSSELGKVFRFPSTTYKAFSVADGKAYCLRRISGCRLTNQQSMSCVEHWKKIKHPSIVNLREVFTTKDFHDHSVVFVYDYHPHCDTLLSRHIASGNGFLPEPLLWQYIIQLSCAIRDVHSASLAVRALTPSKVLVTGRSRVLLGSVCLFDVVDFESEQASAATMSHFQQEDLVALGRIVLALACGTMAALSRDAISQSLAHVHACYSEDVYNIIRYLLGPPPPGRVLKAVNDLMPMIGARFYSEVSASLSYTSMLEAELSKEMQNGRLFRLATKLMMVTDRPESQGDVRWAETGDRYLLRLLKGHLFHTMDEETNRPWIDLAHVVQSLNKLDAGSSERVCLVSPDEKSVVIASYADLNRCLSTAFADLVSLAES